MLTNPIKADIIHALLDLDTMHMSHYLSRHLRYIVHLRFSINDDMISFGMKMTN